MANERLRGLKVRLPPSTGNADLDSWARDVTSALNGLPISIFSTSDGPNASNVTAPQGFLGIEIGSSSTRLWFKRSGSTSTGWSTFSHI